MDITAAVDSLNAEIASMEKGGNGGLIATATHDGRLRVEDEAIGEEFDCSDDGLIAAYAAVRDWSLPQVPAPIKQVAPKG